jgi:hypothetical protein
VIDGRDILRVDIGIGSEGRRGHRVSAQAGRNLRAVPDGRSAVGTGDCTMSVSLRAFLAVGLTLLVGSATLACAQGDLPRRPSGLITSQDSGTTTQGSLLEQTRPWKGHYFASNTPYAPQQSLDTYEPPPAGYAPVFTQLVARHGSRALTSGHDIDYIKQVIAHARAADALTDLGRQLEPQVVSLEKANVQLGYGNLSGRGVKEHQELAARLLARLPEFFTSGVQAGRRIRVLTSGKDRAVDSGNNFVASLKAHMPALDPLVDPPVVNTDLLYFHKAPQNADYQEWLAHDPTLAAKIDAIYYGAQSRLQARRVLERLFTTSFVDTLAAGGLLVVHPDTGAPVPFNEVDAVGSLYSLYQVAPGLSEEGTWAFDRFISPWAALWFGYLKDAQDFYGKGPSFAGLTITFRMAQVLQDDFFNAVEAIRRGESTLLADLRFTHAEIVIPLAALMQLPYSDRQAPADETYTHSNNPWRGDVVTPYAVNIQWDVYANSTGDYLVKMLYNERETPFKAACASIRDGSRYYRYDELKRCYGYN